MTTSDIILIRVIPICDRIFKRWLIAALLLAAPLFAGGGVHIEGIAFKGLHRTSASWLADYLGLQCPCALSAEDLEALRIRLLTTQIFQDVTLDLVPRPEAPETFDLQIEVQEKWTIIPVIRGAFGGGTPLLVAGIYDTHMFGSLWTLGAESRTYGSAPTGGVMWIRAPRWLEGRHFLNLELWRDNRVRSVYDRDDKEVAQIYGSATVVVAEALFPLGESAKTPWQSGLRLHFREQATLDWKDLSRASDPAVFHLEPVSQKRLLARLVYDDMAVLQQNLQGLRFLVNLGPGWSDEKNRSTLEQELYWYGLWGADWNLGFHEWLGLSDDRSYQSLYFLGGFDSVRGLPDGVMYGNKAVYGNLELRKIFHRSRYVWWQTATFIDYGAAGYTVAGWRNNDRASAGFGLRLAVPQVNRLVLRADYAWSCDDPRTSSISIGMNQFIDPYRPL